MITKLKKFTFLVFHREYNELLDRLREAGVVHIIEKGLGEEEHPAGEMLNELKRYDNAIKIITKNIPEEPVAQDTAVTDTDPASIITMVEELSAEIDELKGKILSLKSEAVKIGAWGDFENADFEKLLKTGWQISLFTIPSKRFNDEWYDKYSIQIINIDRGKTYFAVVHKPGEAIELDADPERIAEKSAPKLLKEVAESETRIDEIKQLLSTSSVSWLETVRKGLAKLLNEVEYIVAENQALREADGRLMVLQGWVPTESEGEIRELMERTNVYFYESDPEADEKVPVVLRNSKFARLFEPISNLFDLPDYRELDLTPLFAPFFMMFFGFCLGDAGYGLLFIAVGFLLYKRVPVKMRPFLSLAKYLGVATVVFGIISGTFFGINMIDTGYTLTSESIVQLRSLKVPPDAIGELSPIVGEHFAKRKDFLDAIGSTIGVENMESYRGAFLKASEPDFSLLKSFRHLMQDPLNMFYLAIIIGAIQIIFGMIVKIVNISIQKGFKHSLSTVGWVLLLLTVVVFKGGAEAGIIDAEATKPIFLGFMAVAGVLIFFLNNLTINIFMRVGSGVWDTYNIATSIFGDLLSYIRLFALGISSAILGFVFNDISSQFLSIPYVGWLFFVLLLIVGHSINIFMAALGGFIHPMRLTFVEFYKNAGFKGGGKEYKPFRINS